MAETPQLNENQISIVTDLFQAILKDGNNVVQVVQDVESALKGRGASDDDIQAIRSYLEYVEAQLKANNHYGWW